MVTLRDTGSRALGKVEAFATVTCEGDAGVTCVDLDGPSTTLEKSQGIPAITSDTAVSGIAVAGGC